MSNSLMCEEPSLTIDQQAECAAHAAHKSAGDDDSMSRQRHPRRTSWASPSSNDESPRRLRRLSLPQPLNQELPCSSTLFLTTSFSDDTEVTEVNVDENDFRDVDHSLETWLNGGLCLETDDPPYQFNDNVTETAASASHPLPLEMLPSPSSENIEQLTARQDTIQHSLQNMPPGRNSKHLRLLAMQRRNAILPSCSADDSLLSSEPPNHASAIDQISRSDNSDPSFFVEATLVPDEAKAQGLDVDAHPRPCARPHLVKKQELRVEYPALADIVCTNSTYARSHPGNIYYRQLIAEYVVMINNHQNTDRRKAVAAIVNTIRQREGRFLTPSKKDTGFWDIGDHQAYRKTRQLLVQECDAFNTPKFHTRDNPALEVDRVALAKMVHLSGPPGRRGRFYSHDTLQSAVKLLVIPPKPGPEWIDYENDPERKQLCGQDNTPQHVKAASYYRDFVACPDTISSTRMEGPDLYASPTGVFDSSHHLSDLDGQPIPTECSSAEIFPALSPHLSTLDRAPPKRTRSNSLPLLSPTTKATYSHCTKMHSVVTVPANSPFSYPV